MFERAIGQFPTSEELPLRIAGELIDTGAYADAEKKLAMLRQQNPRDWRVDWLRGRAALAQSDPKEARIAFEAVAIELPGELAPKLALGIVFELLGDVDRAIRLYDLVSRVDPMLTSAAFGLGRCLQRKGDREGAVAAYHRVLVTSSRYTQAQIAAIQTLIDESMGKVGRDELDQAAEAVEALRAESDSIDIHKVTADFYRVAIDRLVTGGVKASPRDKILGQPFAVGNLRHQAEHELRACAHLASTRDERIDFVDAANRIRPKTWF
jgi:serine/threonine-protein kinase PknG